MKTARRMLFVACFGVGVGVVTVGARTRVAYADGAAATPAPAPGATPAAAAASNQPSPVTDIEVPTLVVDTTDQSAGSGDDSELDLANIVQSAAKGVTTVQEAPAIVTVVTADEIRDRQFFDLEQLIDTVPGWTRSSVYYGNFPLPLVRGQAQAVQFLVDGVSMFDPFVNVPAVTRTQPMELVKRVEMITGPGGVLWGSNSLLGILNVITKDAEDVDGVEMGATLGDGNGDRKAAHAYVMGGTSDLVGGQLKLFGHASVDTYQGAGMKMPVLLFQEPPPQPNSSNQYGPLVEADPQQSLIVTLDGKLTLGKLQIRASVPFGKREQPVGFDGVPVRQTLPGDAQCVNNGTPNPACIDQEYASRQSRVDDYDRYAVAEYRTRFAEDHAGLTVKTYAEQFVRTFDPLQVLSASEPIQGGLSLSANLTSFRAGGAADGDVELGRTLRVLYGAEGFNEWKPIDTTTSLQGAGTQSTLNAPTNLGLLPILCPRQYDPTTMSIQPLPGCATTFAFPANRTVFGAYLNPQWRPNDKLIFDVGARVQVAPSELGDLSYPVTSTLAATVVWNFIPNWHLKLNYAQGFRPPVFNNTTTNPTAVEFGGGSNLKVETSDAAQAEINARIYKGDRRIRELSFRIDGSYTRLQNLIQVEGAQYNNSGERGLASVEFLGKLYIQGGHRIELGYTWLDGDSSDVGVLVAVPQHVFNLATVWNLVTGKLSATTNLKVSGASEDPNRLVEYRNSSLDAMGNVVNPVTVASTDLVLDRLPPIADLTLGLTYAATPRLAFRATVYNALFGHFYQPDVFGDYAPRLEYLPNPYEGFRAYVSALYQY